MATLVLLRHGRSEWNDKNLFTGWVDSDLNAAGEEEARSNERHYGGLQGLDKADTLAKYGEQQFMAWRRSYDVPPPPIERGSQWDVNDDPRYDDLPPEAKPPTECLKDVVERMLPYWADAIVPDLKAGKVTLITAHGNSLRALVKHLENISDDDIVGLNIPTGVPWVYEIGDDMRPAGEKTQLGDQEAIAAATAAVAAQGRA